MMEGANDGPQKFWPGYNTGDMIKQVSTVWAYEGVEEEPRMATNDWQLHWSTCRHVVLHEVLQNICQKDWNERKFTGQKKSLPEVY